MRIILLALIICYSSTTIACECARSIRSNFLHQSKGFDVIVLGTFHHDKTWGNTLVVDSIYKGKVKTKTINIVSGGIDCYHPFSFKEGDKILAGLIRIPYSDNSESFVAEGCVTSVLILTNDNIVRTSSSYVQAISQPRIGLISKKMKLRRIEKKIKRRT